MAKSKTKSNELLESEPIIEKNEVIVETDFYKEIKKYEEKPRKINTGLIIVLVVISIAAIISIIFS